MKTLIAMSILLMAGSAFAGNFVRYGSIHFQSASTWVQANKVCQSAGMLYHKKKSATTVEICSGDDDDNCKVVTKTLAQPMNSTRQVCAKYDDDDCIAYKTVAYRQGTTKKYTYRSFQDYQDDRQPISVSSYTVDHCN